MDNIQREGARWNDFQSERRWQIQDLEDCLVPFQRPLIYLPLIMARLSGSCLPFSPQLTPVGRRSPLLYWICPCYDHHSFPEAQNEWVSGVIAGRFWRDSRQEIWGELEQYSVIGLQQRERAMPPTGKEWQIKVWRRVSTILESKFLCSLRANSRNIAAWVWLLKFQLLAYISGDHLLPDSVRPSSTINPSDFKLGPPSAMPAWHATCHLLPGLTDAIFCLPLSDSYK